MTRGGSTGGRAVLRGLSIGTWLAYWCSDTLASTALLIAVLVKVGQATNSASLHAGAGV